MRAAVRWTGPMKPWLPPTTPRRSRRPSVARTGFMADISPPRVRGRYSEEAVAASGTSSRSTKRGGAWLPRSGHLLCRPNRGRRLHERPREADDRARKLAPRAVPDHLLLRRLSRSSECRVRRAHDESGHRPQPGRLRLGRRYLLHQLLLLRGALEPLPRALRRQK